MPRPTPPTTVVSPRPTAATATSGSCTTSSTSTRPRRTAATCSHSSPARATTPRPRCRPRATSSCSRRRAMAIRRSTSPTSTGRTRGVSPTPRATTAGRSSTQDGTKIVYRANHPEGEEELAKYEEIIEKGLRATDAARDLRDERRRQRADADHEERQGELRPRSGTRTASGSSSPPTWRRPRGRDFDLFIVGADGSGLERDHLQSHVRRIPDVHPRREAPRLRVQPRTTPKEGDTNIFLAQWKRLMPVHNFEPLRGRIVEIEIDSAALRGNMLGDPTKRRVAVHLPAGVRRRGVADLPPVRRPRRLHGQRTQAAVVECVLARACPSGLERLQVRSGAMGPVVTAFPDGFTSLGGNQYIDSVAMGGVGARSSIEEMVPAAGGVSSEIRPRPGTAGGLRQEQRRLRGARPRAAPRRLRGGRSRATRATWRSSGSTCGSSPGPSMHWPGTRARSSDSSRRGGSAPKVRGSGPARA